MDYLEKLYRLEPPLTPPLKNPEYRLTYYVPSLKKWHIHQNLCLWQVWHCAVSCARLGRPIRVYHVVTDELFGTEVAILNLFYNRLTDRKNKKKNKKNKI